MKRDEGQEENVFQLHTDTGEIHYIQFNKGYTTLLKIVKNAVKKIKN
jgi:hypothetical protein